MSILRAQPGSQGRCCYFLALVFPLFRILAHETALPLPRVALPTKVTLMTKFLTDMLSQLFFYCYTKALKDAWEERVYLTTPRLC